MNETYQKTLNNFSIRELTDSRGDTYYLVLNNNDQDWQTNGYFCFNSSAQAYEIIDSQYNSKQDSPLNVLDFEYEESEKNGRKVRRILKCTIN